MNALVNDQHSVRSRAQSASPPTRTPHPAVCCAPRLPALLFLVSLLAAVRASPAPQPTPPTRTVALHPRQSSTPTQSASGGFTVQVWAPLVAIVVVIAAITMYTYVRRRRRANAITSAQAVAAHASRELSADQLAGTGGGRGTSAADRRDRAARRARRSASQISTRSLPAYKEDPGEMEMVLARGLREMQDPMPTLLEAGASRADLAVPAPDAEQEQEQEQEQEPRDGTAPTPSSEAGSLTRAVSTADITVQTPLLTAPPDPARSRSAGSRHTPHASIDTLPSGSEDSQHALLPDAGGVYAARSHGDGGAAFQLSAEELQARGDAPPYVAYHDYEDEHERENEGERGGGGEEMGAMPTGATGTVRGPPGRGAGSTQADGATLHPPHRRSGLGFRSLAARLSQLMPSTATAPSPAPAPPVPASPLPMPVVASASSPPTSAQAALAAQRRSGRPPGAYPPGAGAAAADTDAPDADADADAPSPHTRSPTSGYAASALSARSRAPSGFSQRSVRSGAPSGFSTAATPPPPATRSTASLARSGTRSRLASILGPRPGSSGSGASGGGGNGNFGAGTGAGAGGTGNFSTTNFSTTSLASTLQISPPLPHTLTRTAFVYPRGVPTAEQMRFIASAESVARFQLAVPYGQAAEAAAAAVASAGAGAEEEDPPPFDWGEEGGAGAGAGGEGEGAHPAAPPAPEPEQGEPPAAPAPAISVDTTRLPHAAGAGAASASPTPVTGAGFGFGAADAAASAPQAGDAGAASAPAAAERDAAKSVLTPPPTPPAGGEVGVAL
ncbi:hypothetical protein JB92DRAFT_3104430 [Gautieria morchelliformis]|nr:hypothetical protein JB92DRAFT_3104430 [Gautieria morchelliformis]